MPTRFTVPFILAVATLVPVQPLEAEQVRELDGVAPAVVVVPFANLTGDPADAWIGAGVAESLATGFPVGVTVIASLTGEDAAGVGTPIGAVPSSFQATQVARRLGGQYAVTGAYQRLGDQLRITGRMVDLVTGSVVRSVKVDGSVDELFSLQDRLVAQLSGPLPPSAPASVGAVSASPASASSGTVAGPSVGNAGALGFIDGPPPPVAPEVVSRDEQGRVTVRAGKLTEGIQIDGQLDEAVYQEVPAVTDFIQQLPDEGALATERTEAWIMFNETNVYVSARAWDSAPESEWIANELRRDGSQIRQNDLFAVMFDTFYDRRNGVSFQTTPLGARQDYLMTNEGNPNLDWNTVWDVRVGRFEGGWTVEMEIPFKSLRYEAERPVWGLQLRRGIRRKGEMAYLTRLPISAAGNSGGTAGIFRISAAGTLVGLELPSANRNIEVKPYAIGGITRDVAGNPLAGNVGNGDVGVDVKYGITESLTADFTYITDFAQVEVDEQQVNLTRFNLFFPEKREFFLEGRGIFNFAQGGFRSSSGGGFFGGGNAPTLFYSRRIGLQGGEMVPILGGGRVTGKVGAVDVGVLTIQTDDALAAGAASTNFTVVRMKRDVLRRSAVGFIGGRVEPDRRCGRNVCVLRESRDAWFLREDRDTRPCR